MHRQSRFSPIHPVVIGLSLLLASVSIAHATVRNVPAAYPTIQAAIDAAANGDTVLVANGVYHVANLDTKDKAITVKSAGGPNACILDGDSKNGIFTILTHEGATTVINGFTLQHGYANYGGGILMEYVNPTITNCVFQYDSTVNGGAGGGLACLSSSPKISNCTFQFNSGSDGGGMYIAYSGGSPKITSCIFQSNTATSSGGGIDAVDGNPTISNCAFFQNSAGDGGGLLIYTSGKVSNCTLTGNSANFGGGLLIDGATQLTNCVFTGNSASAGAGVYNNGGKPLFTGCSLTANSAQEGGGMVIAGANPVFTNCTFDDNQATNQNAGQPGGGGLLIAGSTSSTSNPVMSNCLFDGNSAYYGAAIQNNGGNPTCSGCSFFANNAGAEGGGLYTTAGKPILVNCVFVQNTANSTGGIGGAMRFTGSATKAQVTNCSFSSNLANTSGDGVYADASAVVAIANSILWDPDTLGYEINRDNTASVTVTYSDVLGGWSGTGNLKSDPLFVDPAQGDLYLQAGSPCLDAGKGTVAYFPKTDIDGVLRSTTTPDMGAYEIP